MGCIHWDEFREERTPLAEKEQNTAMGQDESTDGSWAKGSHAFKNVYGVTQLTKLLKVRIVVK